MSARYKPGSRVQKVWEKYEIDGAEEAVKFGLTLDLKPGTLREWMRMFAKLLGQPVPTVKIPKGGVLPPKINENNFGRRRVFVAYDPERQGSVMVAGPEISDVRWDNGDTADRYQPNTRLIDVDTPAKKGDKHARTRAKAA